MTDIEKPDILAPAPPGFSDIVDALFGAALPCDLTVEDGRFWIRNWRSEGELRKQLARLAYLFGWDVSEEVVVPGWGRIDIVLEDRDQPTMPILIELKLEIKRPSEARKAFQQVDGYGRWWKSTKNQRAELVLCPAAHDAAVTDPVAEAYPEVSLLPASQVMSMLAHWRDPSAIRWRLARSRLRDAQRVLDLHQHAISIIEEIESQP